MFELENIKKSSLRRINIVNAPSIYTKINIYFSTMTLICVRSFRFVLEDFNLFYIWCRWNDIDLRLVSTTTTSRVVELFVLLSSIPLAVPIVPPPSCFLRRSNPFREKVPTDILTCVPNIWTRPRLIPSPHGLLNEPLFKQKNKTKKNSNHLGDEKLLKNKKIRRRSAPYGERRSWVTIDMSHIQNFLYRKKKDWRKSSHNSIVTLIPQQQQQPNSVYGRESYVFL